MTLYDMNVRPRYYSLQNSFQVAAISIKNTMDTHVLDYSIGGGIDKSTEKLLDLR